MSRAKKTAAPTAAGLKLEDCLVTAARGRQLRDGGIAFSGLLWVRDQPVASFRNEGDGGATVFTVRNREAFAEFTALAVAQLPTVNFEQAEQVAGQLWDVAFLKAAA